MPLTPKVKYRNELKYFVNNSDIWALKNRLRYIMKKDKNVLPDGTYKIRSLYFDNVYDTALKEKEDGICDREKFRIRIYNDSDSFIRLEKKLKHNGLTHKASEKMTREQVEAIIAGDYSWLKDAESPLFNELYFNMSAKGLKPKTIVQYKREPYIYPYGNVRVTIDSDLETGVNSTELFNKELLTVPVMQNGKTILEIKYDEYLPDIIRTFVQVGSRERISASKYEMCRIYY